MTPFTQHTGIVATLDRANVDTDAIIPKQFLKSIKRTGYGPNAFFDWRYGPDGTPDAGFELNQPRFEGRSILVTRNNFGCGSSREHAVWALTQDGYRVVIAPWKDSHGERLQGFADIFRSTSPQNLPGYENERYNQLLAQPDSTVDPGEQMRLYAAAEAAMLAGLLTAPSRLAPTADLERSRERARVREDWRRQQEEFGEFSGR